MKLLRNREVKIYLLIFLCLTAVFSAIGFYSNEAFGAVILFMGLLFTFLYLLSVKSRYKKIESLSLAIDKLLHGGSGAFIHEYKEGELSVLCSEIEKMTLSLMQANDELKKEKRRLAESMADISHQLKTPLTSMTVIASLLESENLSMEKRMFYARELYKNLSRANWLIEALLKVSAIDAGTVHFKNEKTKVLTAVNKAVEPLIIPMELKNLTLDIKVDSQEFFGDLNWSAEAFGNIIKNCIEHTPAGGVISISAGETPLFTEIVISDTGEGFDENELPRLFERFYKGKNSGEESAGIGLSLSKAIISAQNGTLNAQNGKRGGAKFRIRFYKGAV